MKKPILPILLFLVLGAAMVAQGIPLWIENDRRTLQEPLADVLPREIPGWEVRDIPLGNTELVDERSRAILNFDEYIFREYTRGTRSFALYVAYWSPGKMPVRQVNSHTPDRCWTWSGWECTEMRFAVPAQSRESGDLLPVEWRVFERRHERSYVYYWHIVAGEVHTYRDGFNETPPLSVIAQDLLRYGMDLRREQFFVRITSPEPLEGIWNEPGFQELLSELAQLCLSPTSRAAQVSQRN